MLFLCINHLTVRQEKIGLERVKANCPFFLGGGGAESHRPIDWKQSWTLSRKESCDLGFLLSSSDP